LHEPWTSLRLSIVISWDGGVGAEETTLMFLPRGEVKMCGNIRREDSESRGTSLFPI